jgi:prevent-host-death family protein
MASAGIREIKDNLSRYIRRTERGERVSITAHGRVVAMLVPPGTPPAASSRALDRLLAEGVVRPPSEPGNPTEGWPALRLPPGTASKLIDEDRGEG